MGNVHPPAILRWDAHERLLEVGNSSLYAPTHGNSKIVIGEGTMDIHWHQDRLRRVIEIRGEIDESFLSHLSRSVVDLGRRDLVIDLSECAISLADYESLRHLEQRLGSRTLLVLVGTENSETVAVQKSPISCSDVVGSESRIGR